MISRDWRCQNCGCVFHSFEKANPPCEECGCVRVDWIPNGGHIGKVAPRADATLRGLADQFGMTNMNSPSPSRLNRAMPALEQPKFDSSYGQRHFAPGFSSPVSPYGATCTPSTAPIDVRGKVQIGVPRVRSESIPDAKRNASITYHRSGGNK
jgi:hypothetical protein